VAIVVTIIIPWNVVVSVCNPSNEVQLVHCGRWGIL